MDVNVLLIQMLIVFSIVIIGYLSGRAGLMDNDFSKKLSSLIIDLTCPCLIIASTMGDKMPSRALILPLIGIGALTYFLLIIISTYLPRLFPIKKTDHGFYSFMLTYGNVGFIGYPVVASIFGTDAVFYASLLNIPNTLTIFIWGESFITGKKQRGGFKWERLYCPAMIGTYISIVIVALQWKAPFVLAQPLTLVGSMTVPGSLLIIGNSITHVSVRQMIGSRGIYTMTAFRLLLTPLFLFFLFRCLGVDSLANHINTIIIAMPVASFGTMFCLKFGKDETIMTQGTFITTLLAILSIPLVAFIINMIPS